MLHVGIGLDLYRFCARLGGAVASEKTFNIPGHSFAAGDALYFTAGGAWADAQADDAATLAQALVTNVSGDNVTMHGLGGSFVTLSSHGLGSAGNPLYVSEVTAALLTTTLPTTGFVQQVGDVIDSDTLLIQGFEAEVA